MLKSPPRHRGILSSVAHHTDSPNTRRAGTWPSPVPDRHTAAVSLHHRRRSTRGLTPLSACATVGPVDVCWGRAHWPAAGGFRQNTRVFAQLLVLIRPIPMPDHSPNHSCFHIAARRQRASTLYRIFPYTDSRAAAQDSTDSLCPDSNAHDTRIRVSPRAGIPACGANAIPIRQRL